MTCGVFVCITQTNLSLEITRTVGLFQVSLTGLAALLALLHHSHFYAELQTMLSMYYPQPAIHPVSVAGLRSPLATPTGSQSTALTAASGSFDATFIGIGAQVKLATTDLIPERELCLRAAVG